MDIKGSLDAFVHGQLDFNGLLEIVGRVAVEDPVQIPELIDRINALYREGRLPPQLYGALLSKAGQGTPTTPAGTSIPSGRAPAGIATPEPGENIPDTGPEESDKTRIASPSMDSDDQADRTRIAAPSTAAPDESDATRIPTRSPSTATSEPADTDRTRIATDHSTGVPTGRSPTATTGAPSSTSNWGKTTGIRTATRKISNEPAVGDILKERFVLEEELGRGGMGIVFKALDQRKVEARDRHPYVALKLLNESFKQHAESLMALQREARKAQDLKHPNVISIFDFDKDGHDNYFIAMELLDGHPLDKTIKSLRGSGMPKKQALRLITQMGQALAAAHNHKPGIIHSDFKPGNVFLTPDDEVKVFDFGIARAAKPKTGEAKGDVTAFDARTLGALTPTYASLEMLEGQDPDPRDDIYALAIVAYELLSGARPFGRKPANDAMSEGMTPKRIEGLTRRQWKGLQRGLAFRRKDRSANVEVFLDDLKFRKSKAPVILALTGISLGLASWLLIPPYLEKRRESDVISSIEQSAAKDIAAYLEQTDDLPEPSRENINNKIIERLIQLISSGDATQISEALTALEGMPTSISQEVVSSAKESILSFYIEQADAAFSPTMQRYDYAAADLLLKKVSNLYPDSIQVFRTEQRIEDSRNDLLNELDSRFNQHLSNGRLVSNPNEDDITDVLRILEQLDPTHQLLTDARLPDAYSRQASAALEEDGFDQAEQLVRLGLERFQNDPALNNIQSKIRIAQEKEQARARLAKLQQRIEQQLPLLSSLQDYLDLRGDLSQLNAINPLDPLLSRVESGLKNLLDTQFNEHIAKKEWQLAGNLLEEFASQLSVDYQERQQKTLTAAHDSHEKAITDLFNDLAKAVADGRLTRPSGRNAMTLLEKAKNIAADDERVERSLASIAQAYLDLSRKSRADGEWEQARKYVQQGLALQSKDAVTNSLQSETIEITKAEEESKLRLVASERERLEREKQQKIHGLYEEFNQRLNSMTLSVINGKGMLNILDRLAALNPTDPLLEQGRKNIADRFDQEAQQLSQNGQWKTAAKLIENGIEVIPESGLLAQRLEQLNTGYENQLATDKLQHIRDQKADIEGMIARPSFTSEWSDNLLAALKAVQELLPATDPWAEQTVKRVGSLYLKQASLERTKQQFAKAAELLQSGARFAPQMTDEFGKEQAILAAEEKTWETENQQRVRLARLEGAKQSLLTQAKANDITTALKTLSTLRKELAANDEFLIVTGPEAIGNAYLRLAERRAKRNDYKAAIKLLNNGLKISPDMPKIQKALTSYQFESSIHDVRVAVQKFQPKNTKRLKNQLKQLQTQFPKRYASIVNEFASILTKRIEKTQKPDDAETLLKSARALFPDNRQLSQISIAQPPKPSVIAAKGLNATKAGQLTKAQQFLKEAEQKEKGHSDLLRLRTELKKRIKQAEDTYQKHIQALKAGKRQQAKSQVEKAIAIWTDNQRYQKKLAELKKPVLIAKTKDKCNPKFAGYGKRSSKFRCYDLLKDKQKGPIMVVVPAGGGNTTPYAIGRYEISVGDFNTYCQLSGNCKPISGKNSKLPLTNTSVSVARKYARWLTEKTGATYRLPTTKEWTHAAGAKGSQLPGTDFNCLLLSGGSIIKGGAPVNVNVAPQNSWGLFNYIGNAQEWVATGKSLGAMGGHYNDPSNKCNIKSNRNHNGKADSLTGFRLLREIRG